MHVLEAVDRGFFDILIPLCGIRISWVPTIRYSLVTASRGQSSTTRVAMA